MLNLILAVLGGVFLGAGLLLGLLVIAMKLDPEYFISLLKENKGD